MTADAPILRARKASRLVAQAEAAATAPPFEQIPEVDLTPMGKGDQVGRRAVAEQLREACMEVGFFYITGHGVDPTVVEAAFKAAERFFDLPYEEKVAVSILHSKKLRGYTGLLEENTDCLLYTSDAADEV